MAIEVRERRGERTHAADTARGHGRLWYSLYGLRVCSDVPLPVPPIAPVGMATAACIFSRARPGQMPPEPDAAVVVEKYCDGPCHNGAPILQVRRGPSGTWIWNLGIGTCHVAPGARRVEIYPEAGADERALGLMLLGQVATFVMFQLGYPSLHASAVVTERGAVAFLGQPGQGKSTMAACFLRHGAPLLTDDVLPLRALHDGIYGVPGPPIMKLWPETAECTLRLSEQLPSLTATVEKKLLTLDHRYLLAQEPARLCGLYMVRRYMLAQGQTADVTLATVNPRDALRAVLSQTMRGEFLHPAEVARLLPVYSRLIAQAPVHVLRFPNGFEHQDQVRARILEHLESL
jgi:hypothetical protein